jgi:hypothetical protein
MSEFLEKNWVAISKYPFVFISTALIFLGLGFSAGKLFYGSIADTARERLEATRDDMARLERAKREESEIVAQLRQELSDLGIKVSNLSSNSTTKYNTLSDGKIANSSNSQTQATDLSNIQNVVSKQTNSFFLQSPHTNILDAMKAAQKNKKLVFAVIYDEGHPKQSKLTFSLGYFMEYYTTKKLVDEYFVPVLLKASDNEAKRYIPEDDPLENCLWVVIDPDGKVLRREGVYANPDEGLKRVRAVIKASEKSN